MDATEIDRISQAIERYGDHFIRRVFTEGEIAYCRGKRDAARRSNVDAMLRDLSEVRIGDPVVHEQHGIGRYVGLASMDLGEGETEFLTLEYAGNDKLYVPVSSLHLISRYSGAAPEQAPLHTLGSGQWDKAKRKAAAQVRDTAAELLSLYAQRASRERGAPAQRAERRSTRRKRPCARGCRCTKAGGGGLQAEVHRKHG